MKDCLFCKIAGGEIKANCVYENDSVVAFRDINPQAPTHVLVIPRQHVATLNDLTAETGALVSEMFLAAKHIAAQDGIAQSGYRTVMNCNRDAGQSVFHIHLHVLGGRSMDWPPG